jgi:hypothetical protein
MDIMQFCASATLEWGQADILALGPDPRLERIGELATCFAVRGDDRAADLTWVVLPPGHGGESERSVGAFVEALNPALAKLLVNTVPTARHVEAVLGSVALVSAPSFDGDGLVALLKQAPPKTGVIVMEAHHFRLVATRITEGQADEDVWSAHVHQLLIEVEAHCRTNGQYVLLDLGTFYPSRQSNLDLLCSVGEAGVSGSPPSRRIDDVVTRVSAWHEAAKAGEVGRVIGEIEDAADLSPLQRLFLKLDAFSVVGLHDQVRVLLKENPKLLVEPPVEQALHIARIAETADDDDRAEALVRGALPGLRTEREFVNAFAVALKLARRGLVNATAKAFARFHPNAPMLRRHEIGQLAREGDYSRASTLLALSEAPEGSQRALYYALLADGTAQAGWAPEEVRRAVGLAMPDRADEAVVELTLALEREHRRPEAIVFLLARAQALTGLQLVRLIRLASGEIQAGGLSARDPIVERIVDLALAHLARRPGDGHVRIRITELLAPTMTANRGLAILVAALLKRAETLPPIRERPPVDQRPDAIDPVALMPVLERIWDWLQIQGGGLWLVGRHRLPPGELDLPADRVIAGILKIADYTGARLADEDDQHMLVRYIAAASAVAPLSHEPDEDLTVVRTAAIHLLLAGKGQAARDLAQFALDGAGDRPERRRTALFTFADIYARLGMKIEALVALAAGLEVSTAVTWDQIWFETNLVFRLLRDVGMSRLGRPILARSRQALEALGVADRDGYRVDTFALHAATDAFDAAAGTDAELVALLAAAQANAEAVMAQHDDALPVATLLNRLLAMAHQRSLVEAQDAERVLARIVSGLPIAQQTLARAMGNAPVLADIAAVAASIGEARYVGDAGYDLRLVRQMTRRLVGQAIKTVDPEALAYAIEASADHAILVRRTDGETVQGERLLARPAAPLETAARLSDGGVAIVGMALFEGQLATIEFEDGALSDITLEPPARFSEDALTAWSERFPRAYSLEDGKLDQDAVRDSVAKLGLTRLPVRSILVADAQLQRLPPNLLTLDGNYAGFTHAIGIAPSLEWLAASRTLDRIGDGGARMWIPVSGQSDKATLTLMRNDVEAILERHHTPLELATQPSDEFAMVDVAIIGAHGGLAEVNRYFRSITNDEHSPTDIGEMAELTRNARLTILFVCSGGRIDADPETGMVVGLSKQILARGCSAVIAPAWPIPFTMARPWLDGFLPAWRAGAMLLDAFHAGNLAVAKATSWDPKRTLAMTLYGDPFIRAGERA